MLLPANYKNDVISLKSMPLIIKYYERNEYKKHLTVYLSLIKSNKV